MGVERSAVYLDTAGVLRAATASLTELDDRKRRSSFYLDSGGVRRLRHNREDGKIVRASAYLDAAGVLRHRTGAGALISCGHLLVPQFITLRAPCSIQLFHGTDGPLSHVGHLHNRWALSGIDYASFGTYVGEFSHCEEIAGDYLSLHYAAHDPSGNPINWFWTITLRQSTGDAIVHTTLANFANPRKSITTIADPVCDAIPGEYPTAAYQVISQPWGIGWPTQGQFDSWFDSLANGIVQPLLVFSEVGTPTFHALNFTIEIGRSLGPATTIPDGVLPITGVLGYSNDWQVSNCDLGGAAEACISA